MKFADISEIERTTSKSRLVFSFCTGTRIRTQIKGFGDLYSTIELCPYRS